MKTTAFTEMMLDDAQLKIHEDDLVVAMLDRKPVSPGHAVVFPKEPHPIIELTPDEVLARMMSIANKLSVAMFEELKCQGTDLIICNGIPAGQTTPHVSINVIPRKEGDGLDFSWEGKQLSDEEFSAVEMKVKKEVEAVPLAAPEATLVEPSPPTVPPRSEDAPGEPVKDLRVERTSRIPRW